MRGFGTGRGMPRCGKCGMRDGGMGVLFSLRPISCGRHRAGVQHHPHNNHFSSSLPPHPLLLFNLLLAFVAVDVAVKTFYSGVFFIFARRFRLLKLPSVWYLFVIVSLCLCKVCRRDHQRPGPRARGRRPHPRAARLQLDPPPVLLAQASKSRSSQCRAEQKGRANIRGEIGKAKQNKAKQSKTVMLRNGKPP